MKNQKSTKNGQVFPMWRISLALLIITLGIITIFKVMTYVYETLTSLNFGIPV